MSFDSPLFIVFFALSWICFLGAGSRRFLFLPAGVIFLASVSSRSAVVFLLYLAFSFLAAIVVSRASRFRRILFIGVVGLNLLALIWLRLRQQETGFFPLGFSFYSFAGFTYLFDVYGRKIRPDLGDFSSATAFFPTLSSGPICRVTDLAVQLKNPTPLDWPRARAAAVRISSGFFKKGISELIGAALLPALDWTPRGTGWGAWLEVIVFAAKFYADFSGYSDIAIGISGLLGIDLPENFNLPFWSRSIAEYWRRWHISLNLWVNTYVFRPLIYSDAFSILRNVPYAGSALFLQRHYFAAMVAMLATGLWHGLTANFFLWGLYMGALLCLELLMGASWQTFPRALQRLVTFFLVLNGFAIFMAKDLRSLAERFSAMYSRGLLPQSLHVWPYFFLTALVLVLPHTTDFILQKNDYGRNRVGFALMACTLFLSLHFFLDGFQGAPFEYFKF